ncbi:MAG TPA: M28 family metallopeptidase [Thermoanaerobaculia bacterium]|nr:M28 family metallopeptidase [Thermoanaerobaculia bacterium]
MRRLLVLILIAAASLAATPPSGMLGFSPARAESQRDLEEQFDALLNRENLDQWLKELSAQPHHAGSPGSKAVAESIAQKFRSWGFDTEIDTYHVLLPTPRTRKLELIAPTRYEAKLEEPALEGDATSSIREGSLPPYHAYSIDGDVTGELVYVNYGIPGDYETLESLGISVAGKIVIARYGGSWRGIKPKVAAEHGAIGCIIYSDPRDDGYFQGDVYPEGAFKNEWGVQRGSVMDMPLHPGDPLTPGVGSTRDAKRLPIEEAKTLTRIPVLPISYGDALPLLRAIGGPVAPLAWRGALPITYHVGPGPARVRLALEFNWNTVPAHNVIARLRGAERPDEWVIRGNHHDGWNFGANDPLSGMVALMEEARAVGQLARNGWKPKRTMVYAGWDAEEQGLLGSTEWAEHHASELKRKAVIYINTDSNGRGFLYAGASHSLERLINEAAREVTDPQRKMSVWQRMRAGIIAGGGEDAAAARDAVDLPVSALGSGSDYTPFLQHLGIASVHVGFGGENAGGSYHSIYDSYDHYSRFGDPGFHYGIALARVAGRLALRFAEADILPFRFTNFATTVEEYVGEVEKLTDTMRKETEERNWKIREGIFEAAADPTKPFIALVPKDPVPHLELAVLRNAAGRVKESAARYDAAAQKSLAEGTLTSSQRGRLNQLLAGAERMLTNEAGLPGRPWFKHQVYAPGFYTGYGVKTLPGVREAIEQREWSQAEEQAKVIAAVLDRFASHLDQATAALGSN